MEEIRYVLAQSISIQRVQLTTYYQGQSVSLDANIGQQIQKHNKLRERAQKRITEQFNSLVY